MKPRRTNSLRRIALLGVLAAAVAVPAGAADPQAPSVAAPAAAPAAKPAALPRPKIGNQVDIAAESMDYYMAKRTAVLSGKVVATDGSMVMSADTMTAEFSESNQPLRIEASGHVAIAREGTRASGGKAVYDVLKGMVVLTDKPVLEQNGSRMVGAEELIYLRDEGRFYNRGGRVRLLLDRGNEGSQGLQLLLPETKGEAEKKTTGSNSQGPVEILSDSLQYLSQDRRANLSGNVVVLDERATLKARDVDVFFDADSRLSSVTARNTVDITSDENRVTADQADYNLTKGQVVLTGKPILYQPGCSIEGADSVVFDRHEQRFQTFGRTTIRWTGAKPAGNSLAP